ncbi:hypothetical protein [Vibrio parahaemolyticus]|nr:hypothetical protein [Vibrio parahaemolyticus]
MQDLYELERKLVENGADMKGLKVVPAVVDEKGMLFIWVIVHQ